MAGRGRTRFAWSEEQLSLARRMVAARVPLREVARALGCSPRTVQRRLSEELGRDGRPGPAPVVPSKQEREAVRAMAGFGIPHEEIARVVGCAATTLRDRFREELDLGATQANVRVAQRLFNLALEGNVSAAIFWCKARMGWRDRVELSPGPPSGRAVGAGPEEVRELVERLSPDGRAAMRRLLAELGAESRVVH